MFNRWVLQQTNYNRNWLCSRRSRPAYEPDSWNRWRSSRYHWAPASTLAGEHGSQITVTKFLTLSSFTAFNALQFLHRESTDYLLLILRSGIFAKNRQYQERDFTHQYWESIRFMLTISLTWLDFFVFSHPWLLKKNWGILCLWFFY